jgi:cell division inhibitor SepF
VRSPFNRFEHANHSHDSYRYGDEAYENEAYGYDDSYDSSYTSSHDDRYSNDYGAADYQLHQQRYQPHNSSPSYRGDRSSRIYYSVSDHSPYSTHTHSDPSNKVTNIAATRHRITEVLVIEPTSFEDIPYVVQALRNYKSVVLNLATMDPDHTQRAIDFITGGTHAMDGNHERIGEGIFLFTPSCVQVSSHISNL